MQRGRYEIGIPASQRLVADVSLRVERNSRSTAGTIYVVDDDAAIRSALDTLFRSVDLVVRAFATGADFLSQTTDDCVGCVVLDVRMPSLNGLELQARMQSGGILLPIVFMTGHGDIPMTVEAMRAGAVDFLEKPFRQQDMLNAVNRALEISRERQRRNGLAAAAQTAYMRLTPRERDVLRLVVQGRLNKQVAAQLGVSEVTVKQHRRQMMQKMKVDSLAQLVKTSDMLGLIEGDHLSLSGY